MGALARALLLPLLAQWLLRAAPAPAPAPFTLPLRVASASSRGAAPTPGPGPPAEPRADGLALALEPAGGAANFLAMVDNLQGDSGRGYYLEMLIGTPPQKVGRCALTSPLGPGALQPGGSWGRPAVPPRSLASPPKQLSPESRSWGRRGAPDREPGRAHSGLGAVAVLARAQPEVCASASELVKLSVSVWLRGERPVTSL